jgi:hypothetical protein
MMVNYSQGSTNESIIFNSMKSVYRIILLCSVILIGTGRLVSQDPCEILLIGSSYFNFNNLAGIIENLANSSDKPIYIEMCGQNGMFLADHADSPTTEAKINERDWDFVVLQSVGVLVAYPDSFTHHPVYPALVTLCDKVSSNCATTKVQFCLPFAFEDGMTWYNNWTDTYEDMQVHIYDTTLQYSDEIGFQISPVGWAWYGVLDSLDYPMHYLHLSDWNHPSLRGSYLMACAIYASIFQESTLGNSFTSGLPQDEVELFQRIATDTVLDHLDRWNISPLVSVRDEQDIQFDLFQNVPNPFSGETQISYIMETKLHVNISVYDSSGRFISELVNLEQDPGRYKISFDATGLSPGTYTCRMKAGNRFRSVAMICQ